MSPIIIKIIGSLCFAIASFLIVKNLVKSDAKLNNLQNIILVSLIAFPVVLFYEKEYKTIVTILSYIIAIITLKKVFGINIISSIVSMSIVMLLSAFVEIILIPIEFLVFNYETVREVWYISIINNIVVFTVSVLLSRNRIFISKFQTFCLKINSSRFLSVMIFVIISFLVIIFLFYNLAIQLHYEISDTISIVSIFVFLILYYIYMEECNDYNKLKDEYDSMFDCIQKFENWIDDEQLYRHELKNKLSIIRDSTKEKKIISKIDEILGKSIVVDSEYIEVLKNVPKGGLKGLLYYKIAISKDKKVNVTFDISDTASKKLKRLKKEKLKKLSIILGIYLDNAIEAAENSKKRNVTLEIYEINNSLNLVISNTYNQIKPIKLMNKKGYSTKGSNHGKGLYFANKIIKEHKWITKEQIFLNDYYISKLIIK